MIDRLVTLSIPTFQRPGRLKVLLESLLQYKSAECFSIYISENSPQDPEVSLVISSFSSRLNIIYKAQSAPLGVVGNFWHCFVAPATKYVIQIGDDDLINLDNVYESVLALEAQSNCTAAFNQVFNYFADGSADNFITSLRLENNSLLNRLASFFRINNIVYYPFDGIVRHGKYNLMIYCVFRSSFLKAYLADLAFVSNHVGNERDTVSAAYLAGNILSFESVGVTKVRHSSNMGSLSRGQLSEKDISLWKHRNNAVSLNAQFKLVQRCCSLFPSPRPVAVSYLMSSLLRTFLVKTLSVRPFSVSYKYFLFGFRKFVHQPYDGFLRNFRGQKELSSE